MKDFETDGSYNQNDDTGRFTKLPCAKCRKQRPGAGRPFKARTKIRTRVSVERETRGHFIKEVGGLAIDWLGKECHEEETKMI